MRPARRYKVSPINLNEDPCIPTGLDPHGKVAPCFGSRLHYTDRELNRSSALSFLSHSVDHVCYVIHAGACVFAAS